MTFAAPLPWWALAAAAAGCALVAWAAYGRAPLTPPRRGVLAVLRATALGWLIVCLMRPLAAAHPDGERPVVPVLIDASESMRLPDGQGRSRIEQARIVVSRLESAAGGEFRLDPLAFGQRVTAVDLDALSASEPRTDIGDALTTVRERYRGQPVGGVILLSDGADNGSSNLEEAAAAGAPVFVVPIGPSTPLRDREILGMTTADAVLDGASVDVTVTAVAHGYGAEPFQIRLLESGRPVDARSVTPAADGAPVSTVFTVSPPRGTATVYTAEVPRTADELVPENNARSAVIPPPRTPLHVLLVEGAPGFEHAFLERALSADPALQIDSIIRKGRDDRGQNTFYVQASRGSGGALVSGFPTDRASLFAYDVVVLANVDGEALSTGQADLVRSFVIDRGGGVLLLGARGFERLGLRGTALERVLPLDLSDRATDVAPVADTLPALNRATLTAAGAAHPIMQIGSSPEDTKERWAALPALAAVSPLGAARPGASVLAVTAGPGGVTRALVAVQRVGEGRAMVFTGEASWRWRMMLPAGDHTYERFWRQSVRWLGQNAPPPVQLTVPPAPPPGDLTIGVTVRDAQFAAQPGANVDVQLIAADGRSAAAPATERAAGNYTATFPAVQAGVYRVAARAHRGSQDLGQADRAVLIGGVDRELSDPRVDTAALSRIARASGGGVVSARELPAVLQRLRASAPAAVRSYRDDLWSQPWSFGILAALLSTEWLARRRWGLR